MSLKSVEYETKSIRKAIGHTLKYHKSYCTGVLIGTRNSGHVKVEDVVPLFHDRIMTSAMETSLELIEAVYQDSDNLQIVGIYDAPLRWKAEEPVPLSQFAITLAEQVKTIKNTTDQVVLSIRTP